ncbi:MAG TPA: hypothetical protein VFB33_07630 [Candidatus Binataceae bacterium]|nr:hypothetical protein [Candidatus Binataceae bacterium]
MAEDSTQPKGYFEHAEIVAIHDELMAAFDSSWDDPRPLPDEWEHDRRVRPFREQLTEIVRRDLITAPLWGVKDPRLCRLLPLWLPMLERLAVSVRALRVLRHPAEVAQSLEARNGFAAGKSGLLWLRYLLEAERNSRALPRVTLRYGNLLRDWRAEWLRVARALGVTWPKSYDEAGPAVTDFLEDDLRHHQSTRFNDFAPPLRKWIVAAYRALEQENDSGNRAQEILDGVRRELAPYDSFVSACWLERVRNVGLENARLRAALEQARNEFTRARDELTAARASLEQRDAGLASAEAALTGVRAELTAVQAELTNTRVELAQAHGELRTLREELSRTTTERAHTQVALTEVRHELVRNRAEAERVREELAKVYRSRYWRFTRPWRTLDNYLRERRHARRARKRRAQVQIAKP